MNPTPLVLLVEDDLRLAELVRTYLQGNGFRVVIEHRGDRVVEHLQKEGPDLVVLDLGLPGRDGFAVCKDLRSASDLPILIVTARDNDIDHVVGLELGADDYVVKPVEPRVLVARIHALLRGVRAASPT
jgi:DNA-binding response OmpR family regulator